MSDFDFLNEHSNLKIEINDALRIVYSNAVNAEEYYTISAEKCISYIREATTEICKIYSMCYNINQNCRWLNDYINQSSNFASYIGTDAYNKLLYIQQNSKSDYCNNAEAVKNVMWYFYCACTDLHRALRGRAIISNNPHFIYVLPAVKERTASVKDNLFASLSKATNDLANARNGKAAVTENSDEVTAVINDLIDIVKQSNEKLADQEKLINNLASQFEFFTKQNSLQQQDYDRTYSKINEILQLVKQSGSSASIDDVWSKVNTIDDKIRSMEQIQKQKLNTVNNFASGVNKTLDRFVDVNEQYLCRSGNGQSTLLFVLKKFSNVVKNISQNVAATITKYEETGQWTYTKCYAGKDVLYNETVYNEAVYNETVTESSSILEWIADRVNQAADFIRDIDKRW